MNDHKKLTRKTLLILTISLIMTFAGAAYGYQTLRSPAQPTAKSVKIITATDLHFLSPQINDKSEILKNLSARGDGKVVPYSGEIVEAFMDQVIQAKPDYLVLTGDLTYNGEETSHEDLVKILHKVEANNIEVLIIPGNHDISIPFAYAFKEGQAWEENSVTYAEFYEMYKDFGPGEALLKDSASASYIKEVSDKLWIAMIDVNTEKNSNKISKDTLTWLDSALAEAKAKGAAVISGTHQNILIHNERFSDGYLIDNHSDLQKLLESYGVRYNMTGHIHIQNLALSETGLNETVTGALAVSPHNFAQITIDPAMNLTYQTESVNVSAWAKAQNLKDPNLLDFANYSHQYFFDININRNLARYIEVPDMTEEKLTTLATYSTEINLAYFAGEATAKIKALESDPIFLQLKDEPGDNLFRDYINSFLKQPQISQNETHFSLLSTAGPAK